MENKNNNKTKLFYGISGTAIGVLTITSIAVPTAITNTKNKEIRKITLQKDNFDSKRKTLESNYKKLDTDKKTLESKYRGVKNAFVGSFANKAIEKSFLEAEGVLKSKQAWEQRLVGNNLKFSSWDGVTLKNIKGKTELESVILPRVTEIGNSEAFHDSHIREIYLPSVTKIANWAFTGEDVGWGVSSQIISLDNVKTVGKGAFQGAYLLEKLNLGKATSIGDHAFRYCISLKNIDLRSWTDKVEMKAAINLFFDVGTKDTSKPVVVTLSKKVKNYPELESFKKLWCRGTVPSYFRWEFK